MGQISNVKETVRTTGTWTGETMKVDFEFVKGETLGGVQQMNGTAWKDTEYAGNFSGRQEGGRMQYSISSAALDDLDAIRTAIGEIEAYAKGTDETK